MPTRIAKRTSAKPKDAAPKRLATARELERFCSSGAAKKLESIEIDLEPLGVDGLVTLLESGLERLTRLAVRLGWVERTARGIGLENVNGLPALRVLRLELRSAKVKVVDKLLVSPLVQRLEELDVTAEAWPSLEDVGSIRLRNLRRLALRNGQTPPKLVTMLETIAPNINFLNLTNGKLAPTTASHFGDPAQLPSLQGLDITGCTQWGVGGELHAKHVDAMRARFGDQLIGPKPRKKR